MLSKDLNEVAAKLRTELAPRGSELLDQMAKLYAAAFTEQELKDALAFYKSPLGKKVITEEPNPGSGVSKRMPGRTSSSEESHPEIPRRDEEAGA